MIDPGIRKEAISRLSAAFLNARDFGRYAAEEGEAFAALCTDVFASVEPEYDAEVQRYNDVAISGAADRNTRADALVSVARLPVYAALQRGEAILDRLPTEMIERPVACFVGPGVAFDPMKQWRTIRRVLANAMVKRNVGNPITVKRNESIFYSSFDSDRDASFRSLAKRGDKIVLSFQKALRDLLGQRSPDQVHRDLANLLQRGTIDHLVCLNWDDAVERVMGTPLLISYLGAPVREARLWKPRGCINKPNVRWLMPHEADLALPEGFADRIADAGEGPWVVLFLNCEPARGNDYVDLRGAFPRDTSFYDVRPIQQFATVLGDVVSVSPAYAIRRVVAGLVLPPPETR